MSELGGFGIRKGGGGGTPITVPVSIANGGTNATSFTAPSGGVSPIPYFDGTRFVTDATPSHLGYDASTDTVYTGKIIISSSGTQTAKFINTATQSPTAGSGMEGFSDSGTAMVSGNRLGFYTLGGATDTSHTTNNSIAIEGFATENWSGTSAGAKLTFSTTANGGTTRGIALELGQDKSVKISNAWLLPTTAPTSGQVLGYVSSGVSGWVTPTSASGIWGISNSSGVYTYYATLTLAMASAVSGDTIEQFANVTESSAVTITWKNGVNFNGNGYTYKHTATSGNIIDLASDCNFYNWNIEKNASSSTGIGLYNNAKNNVNFNGVTLKTNITSGGYQSVYCIYGGKLNGLNVICLGTSSGIQLDGGGEIISRCSVYATGSTGNGITGPGTLSHCYAIASSGSAISGSASINNCVGISTSGSGISGSNIKNSTGISTSGIGLYASSAYNSTGISTSGSGGGGNATNFYNCTFISSSSIAGSGNSNNFYNCTFESTSSPTWSIYISNFYNCTFNCLWNNASGYAISRPGYVINCTLKVTNSSANCLTYSTPLSSNFLNNVYIGSATPINANITQLTTNTKDNQGNILL